MDYHAEAVIADEFMKFLMNGSLYQGSKPVMWSPVEKTALAEAEVEYHDHTSHQVWVRFRVQVGGWVDPMDQHQRTHQVGDDYQMCVIWTTTPWTIPQNRAVAFNPEIAYGLYEVTGARRKQRHHRRDGTCWPTSWPRAVLAQPPSCRRHDVSALARCEGRGTEGAGLAHPFRGIEGGNGEWDYDVPMLPGDHVTDDAGTGFVHTAPSHGDDDYQLGQKFGLPMTYNVEADGSYRADLPLFGGQHIILPDGKEGPANVSVIKQLAYSGALFAKAKLKHSYPHSWRSKAPADLPQHAAVVRRHRQAAGRRHGRPMATRSAPRAELDQPAGEVDAADRAQPAAFDDRGAARLGAVAPARLGRAADLLS
jgi:isoleucyl-tRNA synthetase